MLDSDVVSFGLFLLAIWWILASIAVTFAAAKRGREKGPWLFLSLILGPLFSLLLLIAYPQVENGSEEVEAVAELSITRG
jgi:uncharacterized membrane protein HdeD (DUF308 family)